MFSLMRPPARRLEDYLDVAGAEALAELRGLAEPLRGARLLHVSFSPYGTAASELVSSLVPLLRDVGLDTEWLVTSTPEPYARAAHDMYLGLSGRRVRWGQTFRDAWRRYGETLADQFPADRDFVIVHEPQPVSLAARLAERGARGQTRWVWHTLFDLRPAQPEVWADVWPDLAAYDAVLLSSRLFAAPEIPKRQVVEFPPGLDPLATRNQPLGERKVAETLSRHGIDPRRPLVAQVGPLDSRYDPLGALRAFREARELRPGAQLVLLEPLGAAGGDAWARFERMLRQVGGDPDVYVLAGVAEVGHLTVNAIQRAARVVLQRAVSVGYPMTVVEAQWKARPVIVGKGTMRDLILPGESGVVAEDDSAFAAALVALLGDDELADRMGAAGKRQVRDRYLITRLLRDELRLLARLGTPPRSST